ncbi:unannotated protein [freshwater metagenome]|uniref:Unannotated protein n=1 Tax=freshwater metagenome TaxID=449393 RepID=A0A6J6E187_9ZZZZ
MEDATNAVAYRNRNDRAWNGVVRCCWFRVHGFGLAHPTLFFNFFKKVGDANGTRATNIDGSIDRCADVISVNVAIPNSVATYDDD